MLLYIVKTFKHIKPKFIALNTGPCFLFYTPMSHLGVPILYHYRHIHICVIKSYDAIAVKKFSEDV